VRKLSTIMCHEGASRVNSITSVERLIIESRSSLQLVPLLPLRQRIVGKLPKLFLAASTNPAKLQQGTNGSLQRTLWQPTTDFPRYRFGSIHYRFTVDSQTSEILEIYVIPTSQESSFSGIVCRIEFLLQLKSSKSLGSFA
jgi:hypothetical protein